MEIGVVFAGFGGQGILLVGGRAGPQIFPAWGPQSPGL